MIICGRFVKKQFMRGFEIAWFCWPEVKEMSGRADGFSPKTRRHGSLKKNGAEDIVGGSDRALGFSVLRGSVRARKTEGSAVRREEGAIGEIIEFLAVVALNCVDNTVKVCANKGMKSRQRVWYIRFGS
jgi:hypothetical protein